MTQQLFTINRTSRRRLLSIGEAAACAAALAGCTITTSGGTSSVTINTAKIAADGQAIITALAAMVAAPSISLLLGVNAPIAETAFAAASAALAELNSLTGGSVTVGVDTSKVQSLVQSLIADAQTVLKLVQAIVPGLPSTSATTVGNYIAAVQTLLPFVSLAASLAPSVGSPIGAAVPMSEGKALAVAMAAKPL